MQLSINNPRLNSLRLTKIHKTCQTFGTSPNRKSHSLCVTKVKEDAENKTKANEQWYVQ